ncbi:restriction endonuclease subunit S [Limosilactobacillus reuteri]|uniref:Restriction endonuclease subunit S n=1 Tax=Limosilactobacillus reuteri TaxID=1598 RepID=A0A6A8D7M1_LIMRT|nr:restriction endonuclease subunit S [Limosilactobacillus reuteri]MRG68305.1 restriction endonuclease subunit S [Limosilactobacillus reuteri]WLR79834.1 restriction endonuclease subunit S [Limosilactobacillus reuteri]
MGEISKRVRNNDGRMNLPLLTISARYGWMTQQSRFSASIAGREKKNYTLLKKHQLSYNHGNSKVAIYGTVYELTNYDEALVPKVYHSFSLTPENSSKFIESYFHTKKLDAQLRKFIASTARMDGLLNISFDDFMKVKLFAPEQCEQSKISRIINLIEKLITLQQRKLEQLKQLKKAMLQQLFVDKNNKQPNLRFKNFKGNWEQHRLEEVAQVTMGQSPSSKNYTDNPNDYVLVQGNADLKSNKISPRVWTKEVTKQVHKGEIIMTVRAPVGYLAMTNMDAVIGRGVAAIDGNKYLYYLLQTKLMDRTWEKLSSGSTFESISSNDIKNLEIKVTETEEEKLIAKLMDTVTYFVTLQKNNLTQLTTLKKYLLQNLFI